MLVCLFLEGQGTGELQDLVWSLQGYIHLGHLQSEQICLMQTLGSLTARVAMDAILLLTNSPADASYVIVLLATYTAIKSLLRARSTLKCATIKGGHLHPHYEDSQMAIALVVWAYVSYEAWGLGSLEGVPDPRAAQVKGWWAFQCCRQGR